jgi:DNA uptake protein ComE-like DNA-binding protein
MFKKIRFWLRDYFGFSQTESNGFLILGGLMIFLLLLPSFAAFILPKPRSSPQQDQAKLDSLVAIIEQNQASNEDETAPYLKHSYSKTYTPKPPAELFEFNPNELSVADWQKLGLSPNLAQRIEKYRAKGGKFRRKTDLKKIYGFPEDLYLQLESFIQLPDSYSAKEKEKNQTNQKQGDNSLIINEFDINTVDTTTLRKLKIGITLAQRIINYRDKLGGFVSFDQLIEVYNLPADGIEEIKKYAYLNVSVKKKYLNQVSAEELKQHPYFKKIAYSIVNYRQQHGNFTNLTDLKKIKTIDDAIFQKIAPYLSL